MEESKPRSDVLPESSLGSRVGKGNMTFLTNTQARRNCCPRAKEGEKSTLGGGLERSDLAFHRVAEGPG